MSERVKWYKEDCDDETGFLAIQGEKIAQENFEYAKLY